ncbi:MAG: replicative DNA helicase [Moraxella sp.]|nr:replicative DNA helicase [Moraxella sp.]
MTDSSKQDNHTLLAPPHNIDIEKALLNSMMNVEEAYDHVSDVVSADDFYLQQHKLIFRTIMHLANTNQPYDILTVLDSLAQQDFLATVGGEQYLMVIDRSPATLSNLIPYAKRVRELSTYRRLITASNDILSMAYHPKQQTIGEILDKAESQIFAINESHNQRSGRQGVKDSGAILSNVVATLNELKGREIGALIGLPTPFAELNNFTQGLQRGDLIILAARPSMGKTTLAMNLAQDILYRENLPVLVFSLEMPAESIVMRMISSYGKINQSNLRSARMNEDEWARFTQAVTHMSNTHLYVDDRNNLPPSEIRSVARRVAKDHDGKLGIIIIDYLQLMKVPGEDNRVNEISEISRSLKALAREMNCPVIALSQLNRSLEQRPSKRPIMSDLRESGAIEQDADLIMFIYRDEVYHKDKPDNKGLAELIIGKQRNGPIGTIPLQFIGEWTTFDNFTGSRPDDFGDGE